MTAEQLAEELEVSVRTIYRDALSLQAAGVPLTGDAGHDGGYELSGGYRTTLTGLTSDEASALFLAGLPESAEALGLSGPATSARRKLVAALPADHQHRAARMAQCFYLDAPGWYQEAERPKHLAALTQCVLEQRRIRIRYSSWERQSTKTLDPYGLVLKGGRWYLVGVPTQSGRGRGPSTYRIDQILAIKALEQTFTKPESFDLGAYWNQNVRSFTTRQRTGTALLRFSPAGYDRYVRLASQQLGLNEPPIVSAVDRSGWLTASIPIESATHAHGFLLQLAAEVEVLQPTELRLLLTRSAVELNHLYASDVESSRGSA